MSPTPHVEEGKRRKAQHKSNCDNCKRDVESEWMKYPGPNGFNDLGER